eukprot:9262955-Pyramimonas_sp.AAC.1
MWQTYVTTPTGAFGGAPHGATKRRSGCGGRRWYTPLGPSVELPMEPRKAVLGVADACGTPHWGPRWNSLRGSAMWYPQWGGTTGGVDAGTVSSKRGPNTIG